MTAPIPSHDPFAHEPFWPGHPLSIILGFIAAAAIALPTALVLAAPPVPHARAALHHPQQVVPKTIVPEVEPVKLVDVTPDDAVAYNASIPFSKAPNPAAAPFRFGGSPVDRERAITCLAAAVLYEAGDDAEGQRAVAQVVLNRVRHPAFPSTVCGVVFQGSERRTGCQFTFTCDGALARHYSQTLWDRARAVATAAIDGAVDADVGHATHYHTNWVVPYWSASLDKIAAVHTHLFFRWTGWWGTPAAFTRRPSGAVEPVIPQLAAYSPAHSDSEQNQQDALGTLAADDLTSAALPQAIAVDPGTYVTALDPRMAPSEYEALARRVCTDKPYCKFLGWDKAADVPQVSLTNLPADSPSLQTMAFSFLRDRSRQFEKALWNCQLHPRDDVRQCMRPRLASADPMLDKGAPAGKPTPLAVRPPQPMLTPGAAPLPRATPTTAPAPTPSGAAPVR